MIKSSHTHKLKRHSFKSGNQIYFCALPDCHFKSAPALALGKRSICWRCGNDFIMNEYSLRLAKPHCENCHKPKVSKVEEVSFDIETNPLPDILVVSTPLTHEPLSGMSLAERFNKIVHPETSTTEEDEI